MDTLTADIVSNCISKYLNLKEYITLLCTDKKHNLLNKIEYWKNVLNSRYPEYFKIFYKNNYSVLSIKELIYCIKLYEQKEKKAIKKKEKESFGFKHKGNIKISISNIFSISCRFLSNQLSLTMLKNFTKDELFIPYEKFTEDEEPIEIYKSLNTSCRYNNINMVRKILDISNGKLWEKNKLQLNCSFYYSCLHGRYEIFMILLNDLSKYTKIFDGEYIKFLFPKQVVKALSGRFNLPPKYMQITELYLIACKGGNIHIVKWFHNILNTNKINFDNNMRGIKKAIESGDLDVVIYIINKIITYCKEDNPGDIANRIKYMLHESFIKACKLGKTKIVTYFVNTFIDSFFNIDVAYNDNFAIQVACNKGHTDVVKFLLDDKFKDKIKLDKCLAYAFRNGHIETGKILLKDPRINSVENENYALIESISNNRDESVEILLNEPKIIEYINNPDNNHNAIYLLNIALDFNKPLIVNLLLNNKNIKYENVNLQYIIGGGYGRGGGGIDLSIILDPRINTSNKYINHVLTRLSYYIYSGVDYKTIINELLEYLDPNFKFTKIDELFERMCREGDFKNSAMLLDKFGYIPTNKKKSLRTCIDGCIRTDNLEMFKCFTTKIKPNNDYLMKACGDNSINIVKYLVELPYIDINVNNNQILFHSVYHKHFEVCRLLLNSKRFKKASEVDEMIKDEEWDCNAKERLEYIAKKFRKLGSEYYAKWTESYIDY